MSLPELSSGSRHRVVDLFCGCGGLSRGLERTGQFSTVFGLDINKTAVQTFRENHGAADQRPVVHTGDIRELTPPELWDALAPAGVSSQGDLDCLVGGPPCEGFSRNTVYTAHPQSDIFGLGAVAPVQYRESKYWQSAWSGARSAATNGSNRLVRAYNPFLSDPRNFLFRAFLDVAAALSPKVLLIENVRQMLSHDRGSIATEILATLRGLGYIAEARVLNTAEYGIPQVRLRAFFLAVREDIYSKVGRMPWPVATHRPLTMKMPLEGRLLFAADASLPCDHLSGDRGLFVTTEEAIADLPPAKPEREGNPRLPIENYPNVKLSAFRRFVRSLTATPANHVYRTPSEQVIRRLRAMQPGMKPHDLPPDLRTKKFYYNAYGRLEWQKPANTITKSFIYSGSGKFGHPVENRGITYREAARLQSFDDDFTFYASSQEGIAHMIGSAVPPLLGLRFGQEFAGVLAEVNGALAAIVGQGDSKHK